jgi:hypothetical protein
MKSHRLLFVPALLAAIMLFAGHDAPGQETPPASVRREASTREPSRFMVVPLKQADATEVVHVLGNLFVGGGRGGFSGPLQLETIIADPRTNSLVIRAPEEVLQQVIEIVKQLDAPQQAREIKIFQLRHTLASDVSNALGAIGGGSIRIAVDAVGNRVIAQGDAATLDTVEALLIRLDEPPKVEEKAPAPPAEEDVQVRLVWLVAGLKDSPLADPPADLKNVVEELEKMGVVGLKTAAQVFVKSVPGKPFTVRGSAMLNDPCSLEVSGTFARGRSPSGVAAGVFGGGVGGEAAEAAPSAVLEISVKAIPSAPYQGKSLADLQTSITAPEGHSVVLGVSPVGELTSVFVVQLRR